MVIKARVKPQLDDGPARRCDDFIGNPVKAYVT
jgi:hypothetical protein